MATSGTNWHDSAKLQTALTNFHNKETRFPTREVKEAKQALLGVYLKIFDLKLRSEGFGVRVEYTGSSYEEIKVDAGDLEFDVMIIMTNGDKLSFEHVPDHPGFSRIKPNSPQNEVCFAKFLDDNKMLVPAKVIDKLQGHLADANNPNKIPNLFLRRHGPAIQIDVMKGCELWFSIDMVPAIEIRANGTVKRFVAKPFKGEVDNGASSFPTAWRCSYSLEEKELLKDIDKDNGCRKQTARIVKSLRNREAALSCICSYWIKTTILRLKNSGSWDQPNLGRCVMRVLESLAQAFQTGNLAHYFVPQLNLLSGESAIALQNLASRLRVLLRNETEFYRAIGMLV